MFNWLKKLIITRLLIPVTQSKKLQEIFAVVTQDSVKLKKKMLDHNHDKSITAQVNSRFFYYTIKISKI